MSNREDFPLGTQYAPQRTIPRPGPANLVSDAPLIGYLSASKRKREEAGGDEDREEEHARRQEHEHEQEQKQMDDRHEENFSPPAADRSRLSEPTRRVDGTIICTHPAPLANCATVTFERPCEWRKHMDKHERPHKCLDPQCIDLKGFTYPGGLLRHEREVHGKADRLREALLCQVPHCKRSAGAGFSRRENLNEHVKRLHRDIWEAQVAHVGRMKSEEVASRLRTPPTVIFKYIPPEHQVPIGQRSHSPAVVREGSSAAPTTPTPALSAVPFQRLEPGLLHEVAELRQIKAQQEENIRSLEYRVETLKSALQIFIGSENSPSVQRPREMETRERQ